MIEKYTLLQPLQTKLPAKNTRAQESTCLTSSKLQCVLKILISENLLQSHHIPCFNSTEECTVYYYE